MKNVIRLLFMIIVCLAGCSREPMIQIDSSVQASLDAKVKQSDDTSSVEEPASTTSLVDLNTFTLLPEGSVLSLYDYSPIYPNQLKVYSDGQQTYMMYLNFINENGTLLQVSEHLGTNNVNTKVFAFEQGALMQSAEYAGTAVMPYLLQTPSQHELPPRIVLQEPIMVGTTWSGDGVSQSAITALYEKGIIHQLEYRNIIEVSTNFETYTLKEYYAAQEGLILTWIVPTGEGVAEQQWQLVENYHGVKWTDEVTMAIPRDGDGAILQRESALLNRQTNETLAQAFTSLFREKGWLNDQVSIQELVLDNNVVTVDFTPGIVASVNAHANQEERLLPAIVQTLADYYQVQHVRLTVGGLILTPDRLAVPADGIWQVDAQWLGE
ncbi:GerMN domain-containing protein [Aerococcaceae bacterium NML190938]|nr:GerMN domain-containing protein [Aerococcaceae bacterium NML190938]